MKSDIKHLDTILTSHLIESDPGRVSEWIASLLDLAAQQKAIIALAGQLGKKDPEKALAWMLGLGFGNSYAYEIGKKLAAQTTSEKALKWASDLGYCEGELSAARNSKYAKAGVAAGCKDIEEGKKLALSLDYSYRDKALLDISDTCLKAKNPTKALECALELSPGEDKDALIERINRSMQPPKPPRFPRLMAGLQRLRGGKDSETVEQTQEATQDR